MIPIKIDVKIEDELVKEFIYNILIKYKSLSIKNNSTNIKSASYFKTSNIELLTIKEISKLLKTVDPTVRGLIDKGYLKALKLGRLKVRNVEIQRFLEWAEGKDFSDLNNIIDLNFNT
ncbi:MAG: helix-turn-helix domain-containing protein [Clostridium sp.]|uniref:helix-turn-helix domain-containing protein n=1 Tax=Clostridium sp. TaxID=1506 RepID=UPI00291022AA|nr:helix-turn-helix domain-containing protein [Clostridium sp.]MDU5110791.1 helix-turn-helix domain-containing protein [Clostridium sp.]